MRDFFQIFVTFSEKLDFIRKSFSRDISVLSNLVNHHIQKKIKTFPRESKIAKNKNATSKMI